MLSECPEKLAINQKIAEAVDMLCDPALDLETVLSVLAKTRAELLVAERVLHDHIREHGCELKETVGRLVPKRQTSHKG